MTLNVLNCTRCGKLCVKTLSEICPACTRELDEECKTCVEYIRQNRGTTLHEVSEATGVAVKQIIRFIRDGRISVAKAPNLNFPCEICGKPIQDQVMCDSCRQRMTKELQTSMKQNQAPESDQLKDNITFQIRDRLQGRRE